MFNIEDSKTIHVSSSDYTLPSGNKYNIEYSVYYSKEEKDTPYLFLEDVFNGKNDIHIPMPFIFTKTRALAFDQMEERKNAMKRKCTKNKNY